MLRLSATTDVRDVRAAPAPARIRHNASVPDDDLLFVQRAAAGDEGAFVALYRKYAPAAVQYARQRLGRDDAEAAAHDALLGATRRFDPSHEVPFSAFLFGVCLRDAVWSVLRHRRGVQETFERAADGLVDETRGVPDRSLALDEQVVGGWTAVELGLAIRARIDATSRTEEARLRMHAVLTFIETRTFAIHDAPPEQKQQLAERLGCTQQVVSQCIARLARIARDLTEGER